MTAQDLKNSILQLAVQGKLVPQDPDDEPASELLERICAEKERLIKTGKIKKEKPLAPIAEDEIPFDIPENWEWVRLGNLGVLYSGYAFKSVDYQKSGIQVVRISDLDDDNIGIKDAVYYPDSEELDQYRIRRNSFLICLTGSIGKMAWVKDDMPRYLNQRVGMFVSYSELIVSYLWLFLHTSMVINQWIEAKTSTNGNIKNSDVTDLIVPIPPLAEQERIVAKIEELFPLIEEYDKAEKQLSSLNAEFPDKLKKSILQQAVMGKLTEREPADEPASELIKRIRTEKEKLIKEGKIKKEKPLPPISEDEIPFEIPDTWEWVRLGDLFTISTGMTPLKGERKFYEGGTIPWVTSSLTSHRYIETAESFITGYALQKTTLQVYPTNTIIIAMYGQGKTRGQISELHIPATINQACAALMQIIPEQTLNDYTYYYFLFYYKRRKQVEFF